MRSIESLMGALDELTIAREVATPHDEARMSFYLRKNTVDDYEAFTDVIANYYNHHVSQCVVLGGPLSRREAAGRAKEILEQEYRRQGGNIMSAFNAAHDGTDGGLRGVLDKIADRLKADSIERYIRDAFDTYVAPNVWEQKVEIIRQFITRYGFQLSSYIRADQPERYAQNYEELIRAFVDTLKRTSSAFRRL